MGTYYSRELIVNPCVSLINKKFLGRAVNSLGNQAVQRSLVISAGSLVSTIAISIEKPRIAKQSTGKNGPDHYGVFLKLANDNEEIMEDMEAIKTRLVLPSHITDTPINLPEIKIAKTSSESLAREIALELTPFTPVEAICSRAETNIQQ